MTHVVTAPLIVAVAHGVRHSLYAGATVPSGVKSEDIERLVREGFIREVEDSAPDRPAKGESRVEPSPIPAKEGPGSGKARWAEYAASVGVEVPEGASRDAIIEAIQQADKPTE